MTKYFIKSWSFLSKLFAVVVTFCYLKYFVNAYIVYNECVHVHLKPGEGNLLMTDSSLISGKETLLRSLKMKNFNSPYTRRKPEVDGNVCSNELLEEKNTVVVSVNNSEKTKFNLSELPREESSVIDYRNSQNKDCKDNCKRSKLSRKMIGGSDAKKYEFPFMVRIKSYFSKASPWLRLSCGGTLISRELVLTAAHCLKQGEEETFRVQVHLGYHRLNDSSGIVDTEALDWRIHPDYEPIKIHNDIAVIKIPEQILHKRIKPVCLSQNIEDYSNSQATIIGFGHPSTLVNASNDVLQTLDLKIISPAECQFRWFPHEVPKSQICGLWEGKGLAGPCNGDSGGPLLVKNSDERMIAVGIHSYSPADNCVAYGIPSVSTRISSFMEWILNQYPNSEIGFCETSSYKHSAG